ncbi:transporter substrate-binding domain-containing protein [Buttiauxella selenatireducens]|uniref:Transporter substrate-binding domain-containing protein n=1 Tax=Buttiauxella selenatireducens TaxID=3073902 RepID=A0ABY9S5L3_9ENTR|nr:transporter substrate-binding domain-containing protein [Buttiauxella sp. R73]WMY72320.1 transporter substrate-binding domain-containing protein [Buttiauxella sp. R73]
MKKVYALSLLVGMCASFSTFAASEMRYGVEAEYPPFESRNSAGELEGFDIDLGNAICKAASLKCTWVETSFDALIPGLVAKKFDAINSAMNITEQRRKSIDFTQPIYRIPSQLVGKLDSGMEATPEGLKGKTIGVLQGSIQETYAKEHWEKHGVTVVSYKDQNMAWGDLLNGRIDASLVMSAAGQAGFLSKPQGKGFGFIGKPVSDDTILGSGIGYGLRKGDEQTKKQLDTAIEKVRADGTITALAEKYFPGIDVSVK